MVEEKLFIDKQDIISLEDEETSVAFSQTLIKPLNHQYIKDEVLFVVVRAYNEAICHNFPSLMLCGKKMEDWVRLAGSACQQIVIEDCEDIIAKVRQIETDKRYIAVFYSDTPLLDKATFYKIMDYFAGRSINFLQLTRGFIVKTEFIKNSPNFLQSATGGNGSFEILRCTNAADLSKAFEILNERIVNYHLANGVTIFGKNTVFIEADVEIDSGVIIHPNNIIKGNTIISAGCEIGNGNVIENSILLNGCKVSGSVIIDSKLNEGTTLEWGSKVIKEVR